jgi:hypothetical protein
MASGRPGQTLVPRSGTFVLWLGPRAGVSERIQEVSRIGLQAPKSARIGPISMIPSTPIVAPVDSFGTLVPFVQHPAKNASRPLWERPLLHCLVGLLG